MPSSTSAGRGASRCPAAYAESRLKAIVDGSNFGALITEFAPRLIEKFGKDEPQLGTVMQMITTFGTPLWRRRVRSSPARSISKLPAARAAPLAILCQAGPDADALLAQLRPLVDAAQGRPVPVKVFKDSELVVLSIGYEKEADVLAADAKALAANAQFQQAIGQVQKEPVAILYIDAEAVVAQVNAGMAAQNRAKDAAQWAKVRDTLGLSGIHRVVFTGGFEGRDWSTRASSSQPPRSKGIAALLDRARSATRHTR